MRASRGPVPGLLPPRLLPFVALLVSWGGTGLNKTDSEAVLGWGPGITAAHVTFFLHTEHFQDQQHQKRRVQVLPKPAGSESAFTLDPHVVHVHIKLNRCCRGSKDALGVGGKSVHELI